MLKPTRVALGISFLLVCTTAILPSITPALADTPTSPPAVIAIASSTPGKIVLPERTPVKLILDEDLKSGSAKVGNEIDYELENDLYTPDRQLVAPAGTKAFGKVLKSSGHGMFGKPGKLEISAEYILDPDRTRIPLRGNQVGGGGKGEVAGMVALSLLVTVFGVFINGRDVNLHKGMEIPMYVDQDTTVTPYMSLVQGAPVVHPTVASAVTPPATAAGAVRSLYTLNDGMMVAGTQVAFDGTTYAVSTDSGLKLIKAANVKKIEQLASASPPAAAPAQQAPPAAAAAPAPAAPPPSLTPSWYVFTLQDKTEYVGVPDGTQGNIQFIKNSLGRRALHEDQIGSKVGVADENAGKAQGASL